MIYWFRRVNFKN